MQPSTIVDPAAVIRYLSPILFAVLLTGSNSLNERAALASCRATEAEFHRDNFSLVLSRSVQGALAWKDRPQSDVFVHNILLQSEALLATGGAPPALRLLDSLQPDSSSLRIRRDIDRGNALFKVGRPADSLPLLQNATMAARNEGSWGLLAEGLLLQGNIQLKTSGPESATLLYREALAVAELHNDSYHRGMAIHNLGLPFLDKSRYDEAATYFERSRKFLEESGSPRMTSVALRNLAECYGELGDFERATRDVLEAITVQETLHANFNLTMSYGLAGLLYEKQGDLQRAISYYSRALDSAKQQNAVSTAARVAMNLSGTYIDLEDWTNAELYNQQALQFNSPDKDVALFTKLFAVEIAVARGRTAQAEDTLELLTKDPDATPSLRWSAFAQLGALRAKAGDTAHSNQYFDRALDEITKARGSLSKAKDRITFLSEPIRIYQSYVEALLAQGDTKKALLVADSSRAQVLTEKQRQPAADVRDYESLAHAAQAVIVSYWLTPQRSGAWVVDAKGTHLVPLPDNTSHIRELVSAYRRELEQGARDPLDNPRSAGWKLSQAVLSPLTPYLPDGANVIVIPDGPLHDIGLDTLPMTGDRPRYWIEQATVSVAPSLRVLHTSLGRKQTDGGMLIVGDPIPVAHYTKLSYAAGEIDSVRQHFVSRRKTVLVDRDATVEGYRAARPEQFSLIHFTAHAEANREAPLDSAVILSSNHDEYKLYARDIEPLTADLVTVSACRSAGSRSFSGEGLIGFAWAFLHAGARNVVAGLWDVDDRSTARLMNRMYAEMETGKSPAQALHVAKLELLRSGGNLRKPYYWGPFQAYRRTVD